MLQTLSHCPCPPILSSLGSFGVSKQARVCVCEMERIFGVHASPHLTLTGVRETYGKTEGEEGERR